MFRYNTRKMDDGARTALAIQGAEGKRLTYHAPATRRVLDPEASLKGLDVAWVNGVAWARTAFVADDHDSGLATRSRTLEFLFGPFASKDLNIMCLADLHDLPPGDLPSSHSHRLKKHVFSGYIAPT